MNVPTGLLRNIFASILLATVLLFAGAGSVMALSDGAEPRTTMDEYYYSDYEPVPKPTPSSSGWTCTVDGQVTDCSSVKKTITTVFIVVAIVFFAFFGTFALIGFIVWLIMLIHAISNPIDDKALWIILLVIFGLLAAVIYYFAVKRPFDKLNKQTVVNTVPKPVATDQNQPKTAVKKSTSKPKTSSPKNSSKTK